MSGYTSRPTYWVQLVTLIIIGSIVLGVGWIIVSEFKEAIDLIGPENVEWGPDFQGIEWLILAIVSVGLLAVGAKHFRFVLPSLDGEET